MRLTDKYSRTSDISLKIDHFTVVSLESQPFSECELEVDLVLIQNSFLFLWKLCLKIPV